MRKLAFTRPRMRDACAVREQARKRFHWSLGTTNPGSETMGESAGHHEFSDRSVGVSASSDRAFGLVFSAAFAIVALLPLRNGHAVRTWALGGAVVCLLLALVRSRLLAPFNRAWTRFGLLLHHIVSPIVLVAIFFGLFVPLGLLRRRFGDDPMAREFEGARESYWISREPPGPSPSSMTHMF